MLESERLTDPSQDSFAVHNLAMESGRMTGVGVGQASLSETLINRIFLILVLAQGTFLRLWQLNSLGLNTDEAVYAGTAAAIVQDPALSPYFPIFRAHPLLAQFTLAIFYHWGVNDVMPRLVAVAFGLLTIFFGYQAGKLMYGERVGLLTALFLALMPYLVTVNRQFLLDGPMAAMATLALYLVARYGVTQRPVWLYAAGAGIGLTFLAKETGIVMVGAVYAFLALTPEIRVRIRDVIVSLIVMAFIIAPFPLSLALAGASSTGQNFLVWQLFRRPNHEWSFYLTNLPFVLNPLVILAALLGFPLLRYEGTWREKLLLLWIAVPLAFFQLWPVKGFQYPLPITAPLAILAARTLGRWSSSYNLRLFGRPFGIAWVRSVAIGLITATLLLASWLQVQASITDQFTAGTGGVPGGREAGLWIRGNTPEGAKFMTLGPSMANLVEFYGHRKAYGLAVSTNPLHRNPTYEPISNPDLQLRSGDLHYIVWDSFSAARSQFFTDTLLNYVQKYHGRVVHSERVDVTTPDGKTTTKYIIVIYEVRP